MVSYGRDFDGSYMGFFAYFEYLSLRATFEVDTTDAQKPTVKIELSLEGSKAWEFVSFNLQGSISMILTIVPSIGMSSRASQCGTQEVPHWAPRLQIHSVGVLKAS